MYLNNLAGNTPAETNHLLKYSVHNAAGTRVENKVVYVYTPYPGASIEFANLAAGNNYRI